MQSSDSAQHTSDREVRNTARSILVAPRVETLDGLAQGMGSRCQAGNNLAESAEPIPSSGAILDRLVGTSAVKHILPWQAVVDHVGDAADDALVINLRCAIR
jgi:hypothetical protein